jgi:hypothetical protein
MRQTFTKQTSDRLAVGVCAFVKGTHRQVLIVNIIGSEHNIYVGKYQEYFTRNKCIAPDAYLFYEEDLVLLSPERPMAELTEAA